MWDVDRDLKVLNELAVCRNLNMVGYQTQLTTLVYSAADWDVRKRICEYTCKCLNFDFKIFFDCVDYRDNDSSFADYECYSRKT